MTDWTTLAEKQVAGFGLANGSVVDRLAYKHDRRDDTPALIVTHEREMQPDPLDEDEDPDVIHLADVRVTPTERDGPRKIEPGMGDFSDRVTVEHHEEAPRAYVRHESRNHGVWSVRTAWELHPAEGLVQVRGGRSA